MLPRRCLALLVTCLLPGCGLPEAPPERLGSLGSAIRGGQVDEDTRGAVGLAANFLDIFFFGHCSGSLIAPNLVLTAQHCAALTQGEDPGGGVICGETDFGLTAASQVFRVTAETVRPTEDGEAFYPGRPGAVVVPSAEALCGFDVALLILDGAGVPAEVATPLVPRIDAPAAAGEVFSAVGYGNQGPGQDDSGTRMRFDGSVVDCAGLDCDAGSSILASEWRGNSPTCSGDSGGPALDAEGRVIGVLSRGPFGCVSSVYGDPSAFRDLIVDTALEAAELGGYEPPFWALTGSSTPPPPAAPGEGCVGFCTGAHTCARVGEERTCRPACGDGVTCAEGTICDAAQEACVPAPATESGCHLAPTPARGSGAPLALLVAGLALGRRRRARRVSAR